MSILSEDYGQLLRDIADGKDIEFAQVGLGSKRWLPITHDLVIESLARAYGPTGSSIPQYRVAPATIRIAGHDVLKPISQSALEDGNGFMVGVYIVRIGEPRGDDVNFYHNTEDAAKLHFQALIDVSGGRV